MSTKQMRPEAAPRVHAFYDGRSAALTYVVYGDQGGACAVIDPVLDYDPNTGRIDAVTIDNVLRFVETNDFRVEWILETHIHHDHLSGAAALKERVGGSLGIGEHYVAVADIVRDVYNLPCDPGEGAFDRLFRDGEAFPVGNFTAAVLHTPGHTAESVSYRIGDAVFIGDVLFMPDSGCGRCDFRGGNAHALHRSIRRLMALSPSTRIFVGHDYRPGGRAVAWETTVLDQKAGNTFACADVTEKEFVLRRMERDNGLDAPALLLPSLQVNIRGGRLPPPEANGAIYLKTPINLPPGSL
ncbi:MBL fold metallo-hydrolase [Marinivivus vitaminiproducens]|uniref:MBL fold metallo-hydrolase n=1 Tax=Marinivivus vitaminiproducens TaxID=3035935 RepID=UPI00279B2D34|nr:MBL fold metallo-hydrolase [Geminicoccaceae bacterium SCSIO 64248]